MESATKKRTVKGYKIPLLGLDNYRLTKCGRVYSNHGKGRWLSINNNSNGYKSVKMSNTVEKKHKTYNIHKLLAVTFIPNPDNLPVVDHINGNKHDNRIENLQWTTQKHNVNKCNKTTSHSKKIYKIDRKTNKVVDTYNSITECAEANNYERTRVNKWIKGTNVCTDVNYYYETAENYNEPIEFDINQAKQIKKYPRYYVTEDGNIYSQKNKDATLFLKLSKCKNSNGHEYVTLSQSKDKKENAFVNMLVAHHFIPDYDPKTMMVHHINGIKDDNRLENLKCVKCKNKRSFQYQTNKETCWWS